MTIPGHNPATNSGFMARVDAAAKDDLMMPQLCLKAGEMHYQLGIVSHRLVESMEMHHESPELSLTIINEAVDREYVLSLAMRDYKKALEDRIIFLRNEERARQKGEFDDVTSDADNNARYESVETRLQRDYE